MSHETFYFRDPLWSIEGEQGARCPLKSSSLGIHYRLSWDMDQSRHLVSPKTKKIGFITDFMIGE